MRSQAGAWERGKLRLKISTDEPAFRVSKNHLQFDSDIPYNLSEIESQEIKIVRAANRPSAEGF
jgi:hypothetical protein